MYIDSDTGSLLTSVLGTPSARQLFMLIADRRIAPTDQLEQESALESGSLEVGLDALKRANLIDAGTDGKKYFVTARGLQVARDLKKVLMG